MGNTRINSRLVGDGSINTVDLADAAVTVAKLAALTTKGDLLTFDTAHNRLAIGANGTVHVADSTAAVGSKWAKPASRLLASTVTSTTVGSTLTETTVTDPQYTFAANELIAGSVIRARFAGRYTSNGTAGVTFRLYYGSTVLRSTGVLVGAGVTNRGWIMDYSMIVGVGGAAGTMRNILAHGYNGIAITYITDQSDTAVDFSASGLFKLTMQHDTTGQSISCTAGHIEIAGG